MSGAKDFRYLIPEKLYNEITQKATSELPNLVHGWLFAERKENFGICTKFIMNPELKKTKVHIKPRSWMRYKKSKIYNMRKFKQELGVDIVFLNGSPIKAKGNGTHILAEMKNYTQLIREFLNILVMV